MLTSDPTGGPSNHQVLGDSAFWITSANLCLVAYVLSRIILDTGPRLILLTLIRVLFVVVTVASSVANLLNRRERRRVETDCLLILKEYADVSRPPLLAVPVLLGVTLANQIIFTGDTTTLLAHAILWPVISSEVDTNLTVLAVSGRFLKIADSIERSTPTNVRRVVSAAMDSHHEHHKLIKRMNSARVTDYFIFALVCLIRIIYLIIDIIQELRARNQYSYKFAKELLPSVLDVSTISGRFLLTCWAGTQLTNASEESMEAMLNFKFYQKSRLQPKSKTLFDTFINQLRDRRVSLSVFYMFDLGLGTFTSFVETTVTYVLVVVNTLGAKHTSKVEDALSGNDTSALSDVVESLEEP